jgi:UDP:flavonoid glycosyltransferase YjiC (YdhE family)
MRITLAAMGSRGDAQPMLALGRALNARGHDVVVSAAPDFAQWASGLGLPFHAAGLNAQEWLHAHWHEVNAGLKGFRFALKSIAEDLFPPWFAGTLEAARGSDLLISASQFASPSVAEKLGIPCLGVAYSPLLLRSSYHAPIFSPWQAMPRWMNRLLWTITDGLVWRFMTRPVNAERAKLGLAPVDDLARHFFETIPYLLASDTVLAPAPPDWARFRVTPTGPWFYDDPLPLDPQVEAFLQAGPPPVYVGFGSMVSTDVARLTRAILEGAGAGGRRLLLSKGWAGIGGGHLPPDVMVVQGSMPHAKLFPRMAAVVHHGGAGTTASALRAGVPQVVVPHMADQFHHAHRLAALGIAPPGIPIRRLGAQRLARAVDATLALAAGPRLVAAERLREGTGLARAVDAVEAFAG